MFGRASVLLVGLGRITDPAIVRCLCSCSGRSDRGGMAAAQYVTQHQEFSGILVPTKRRMLGLREDGTSIPDPLIVSLDLSEIEFS